ncbi:DUF2514 family protein [Cupriavidus sp. KK10]|uniref:DUF2514 family protein n=1 Tax=Cupriavidus sp. KK10 TaxID=1478019 RepID=UPI001BA9F773|nr:DUF2514 family protein [Cupriavidus sp. KK10]QUN27576.1 DUF2514 family protein [Cupriavidus sp. KK10]
MKITNANTGPPTYSPDGATALAAVSEAARTEEQRRTAEQRRIANAAGKERDQALVDARTAGAVAEQLRVRPSLPQPPAPPVAHGGSSAAGDPLDVLTDVLSRADARAGELANYADRAGIAGQACEAAMTR